MNEFCLQIDTPEGEVFNGKAVQISVRSVSGELAVLAGHIPFMTSLVSAECRIYLPDGNVIHADYDGGLLSVSNEKVIMITDSYNIK